ncbi:MAG: DNA recombination/repair protein RecA, partial [Cyanobacteria bacterium J06555_13]
VIFLNQLRLKIGVTYGNPETTTGGNALKFYASVRLDIRRIQTLKKGNDQFGIRVKVKVAKNKVAPPFRIAEFDIIFGEGISILGCLLDIAEQHDIVVRKGAWYSFEGANVAQGRDNTIIRMKEDPEFAAKVKQLVMAKIKPEAIPIEPETESKFEPPVEVDLDAKEAVAEAVTKATKAKSRSKAKK